MPPGDRYESSAPEDAAHQLWLIGSARVRVCLQDREGNELHDARVDVIRGAGRVEARVEFIGRRKKVPALDATTWRCHREQVRFDAMHPNQARVMKRGVHPPPPLLLHFEVIASKVAYCEISPEDNWELTPLSAKVTNTPAPAFHVLFVGASVKSLSSIPWYDEYTQIQTVRDQLAERPFTLDLLGSATYGKLCNRLQQSQPQIVHVAAHMDASGIKFSGAHDGVMTPSVTDLGNKLEAAGVRLLVLSGCESTRLAQDLLPYVPAVLAYAGPTDHNTSIEVARALYETLDGLERAAIEEATRRLPHRDRFEVFFA
jgi:hypothetical protein